MSAQINIKQMKWMTVKHHAAKVKQKNSNIGEKGRKILLNTAV